MDPLAPTPAGASLDVQAVAGDASAVVSWSAPVTAGSYPINFSQATSAPAGRTCFVAAPATRCTVSGLGNGVAYAFTVRALTGAGWGVASDPSDAVTPSAPTRPSIVISGTRDSADSRVVVVRGSTVGLVGEEVTAWTRTGQAPFVEGTVPRIVAEDGSFTWSRRARRSLDVFFAHGMTRSNAVSILAPAAPRVWHAPEHVVSR